MPVLIYQTKILRDILKYIPQDVILVPVNELLENNAPPFTTYEDMNLSSVWTTPVLDVAVYRVVLRGIC